MSQFGVDYDAAMAGATLQWRGLSPAWQTSLRGACRSGRGLALPACAPGSTTLALRNRGLVNVGEWSLTVMGQLVRLAGIYESKRIEAMASDANSLE